jgi:putative ABC transport system ATP-binding protein
LNDSSVRGSSARRAGNVQSSWFEQPRSLRFLPGFNVALEKVTRGPHVRHRLPAKLMQPLIRAEGLTKIVQSGDEPLSILENVTFDVEPGAAVAIVGASGSGKTTLLGLLAGLDRPTAGDVVIDGTTLSSLSEDARAALRARLLGFVFQSFQLLPALTALENVMLPLELANAADATARARTWLDRVGLGKRTEHYPRQLSGGEQQRVAIARAFVGEPKLLMADEPTGNLDGATGVEIAELMFRLNREHGTTLVLVTHDVNLASRCVRRLSLSAGRLVGDERAIPA